MVPTDGEANPGDGADCQAVKDGGREIRDDPGATAAADTSLATPSKTSRPWVRSSIQVQQCSKKSICLLSRSVHARSTATVIG